MKPRSALFVGCVLLLAATVSAQSPQTYTLSAEAEGSGVKMTITVYRDGPRERVETSFGPARMTTLFDFAAHKVYWIGWSGEGSCSAGRYLGSRAPASSDPVTGGLAMLPRTKTGPDMKRTVVRSESVNGIPARLEEFAPAKASSAAKVTRVWLADPGNFVVKMEGPGAEGEGTKFEVKQFSQAKPAAALLTPPANCPMTDSEMDDTGAIRAHAESKTSVTVSGEKKLGDKK
ncbi:MAG: hypothetical protein ACE14L_09585 [Terriglobales bacterium]